MVELTQKFNPDEPYGEVFGSEKFRYMQDGVYFDAHKKAVKVDPQEAAGTKKEAVKRGRPPGTTKTIVMKPGVVLPDLNAKAQKENLAAKSAERWAG